MELLLQHGFRSTEQGYNGRIVFTLCIRTGFCLKKPAKNIQVALDIYNCFLSVCYPIGRTLRPSVEYLRRGGHFTLGRGGGGGGGGGDSLRLFALVQNVRGDIVH